MIFFRTLGALALLLGLSSPVRAEGTQELGIGQRLVDDTVLEVDILRVGESIYVRGASDVASEVDIEITSPSGSVRRGALTVGRGWMTALTPSLCGSYAFTSRETGTHRVRFIVPAEGLDPWLRTLTPFDVAVTAAGCDAAPIQGRLHATRWHLRAHDWSAESAFTSSFYVLAHRDIVALDLEGVAGFEYFIQAGPRGLEAPYERTSQLVRVVPAPTTRPVYPLYLNPPQVSDAGSGELGRLNAFRQTREEALLAVTFYESCTWEVTIDRDHDGIFDVARDAPVVRGASAPGDAELRVPTLGLVGAAGARIRLQTDEVHFAGYDVETARPGISFARWNPRTSRREALEIHWDDRALVLGDSSQNPSPVEALDGISAAQHGWGSYTASSPGNDAWVDTWASARTQSLEFALQDAQLVVVDDASISSDAAVDLADSAPRSADAGTAALDATLAPQRPGGLAGGALCSARPYANEEGPLSFLTLALLLALRRRSP